MNPECETRVRNSAKQNRLVPKSSMISWRSLRESNPSFQIENCTFPEPYQYVSHSRGAKPPLNVSTGYGPSAKHPTLSCTPSQTPSRLRSEECPVMRGD